MGCDGGTIPRRDEMVKLKKKAEKADKDVELAAKWKYCALTGEELKLPIVACELGRLYNKEALLLCLLDKSNIPEVVTHIRSLKEVIELNLTPNPSFKAAAKVGGYNDEGTSQYVCPVTGLEMSGRYRFCCLRGCGCVLSERALKEVASETCHKCGRPFTKDDVIVLNGTEEDVARQRAAMEERKLQAKQAKLAKRKRKTADTAAATSDESKSSSSSSEERDSPPAEKKLKQDVTAADVDDGDKLPNRTVSKSKPAASSSKLVSKFESKPASKDSTKLRGGSSASIVAKKATKAINSSFKKASNDPSARDAYKSLFHSADKERPKEKSAHWVTFFPYH